MPPQRFRLMQMSAASRRVDHVPLMVILETEVGPQNCRKLCQHSIIRQVAVKPMSSRIPLADQIGYIQCALANYPPKSRDPVRMVWEVVHLATNQSFRSIFIAHEDISRCFQLWQPLLWWHGSLACLLVMVLRVPSLRGASSLGSVSQFALTPRTWLGIALP